MKTRKNESRLRNKMNELRNAGNDKYESMKARLHEAILELEHLLNPLQEVKVAKNK